MRRVVLLGAPGVGKGTYARMIADVVNGTANGFGVDGNATKRSNPGLPQAPLLSIGEMVRTEVDLKTSFGKLVKEYSDGGKLVPDELIVSLVKKRFQEQRLGSHGYVLDGFPRTVAQAKAFQDFGKPQVVLHLTMKQDYIIAKLLGRRVCAMCGKSYNVTYVRDETRGVDMPPLLPIHGDDTRCDCGGTLQKRKDDAEHVIRDRLTVYENETFPLVEHYKSSRNEFGYPLLRTLELKRGLDSFPEILGVLGY